MRDFLAERDPGRNPQFQRRWVDDPLRLADFQHLGRQVAPRVVEDVARRSISRWLDKAAESQNSQAVEAFQQADAIRRKMGLNWSDLIDGRRAA